MINQLAGPGSEALAAAASGTSGRRLRADQIRAVLAGWASFESPPDALAQAWPLFGQYDTLASPASAGLSEPPQPTDQDAMRHLCDSDVARLEAAAGLTPWPTRRVWASLTAELVEAAPEGQPRELAAVMLMDAEALADSQLAVWATAEAARAALAAAPYPTQPARDFLEGLYSASRPSPQTARRATNAAAVTVTVWGRVYAL